MNWDRIQAAATPMELQPRPEEPRSSGPEAATVVLVLAVFMLHVWLAPDAPIRVPEIVRPVPAVNEVADCRLQNLEHPDLLARCETEAV